MVRYGWLSALLLVGCGSAFSAGGGGGADSSSGGGGADSSSGGGAGSSSGGGGAGSSSGGGNCLTGWKGSTCDTCSSSAAAGCVAVLRCGVIALESGGTLEPTCTTNTDATPEAIGVAKQVYACRCP